MLHFGESYRFSICGLIIQKFADLQIADWHTKLCRFAIAELTPEFADLRFADFKKKFACPPLMLTGMVPTCTFQTMQGITGTSELAPLILKSCTGESPYLKNLVKNKTDIRCSGRRCWSGYAGTMLSSTRDRDSSTGSSPGTRSSVSSPGKLPTVRCMYK
jgi:hypothetical protein